MTSTRFLLPALASLALVSSCSSVGRTEAAPQDAPVARTPEAGPADAKQEEQESPQKELDKKRFELECKRLEARIERMEREAATRAAKDDVDEAEFERAQAQQELENFQKIARPHELAEGQLELDHGEQRLKEQQQELDELLAMYKNDTFADLTKELVVARHRAAIEFARRGRDLGRSALDNKRDFDLAQKEAQLAQKLQKAEHGVRDAKAKQERTKQETELKYKRTDHEIDELEAEVKKLDEKVKAAKAAAKPVEKAAKAADKPAEAKKEEKK